MITAINQLNDAWILRLSEFLQRRTQPPQPATPGVKEPDITAAQAVAIMNAVTNKVLLESGLVTGDRMKALGNRIAQLGKEILDGKVPYPDDLLKGGPRKISGRPP